MTVSRVLNQPQLVTEPKRARVQAAIRELDYVVNELARQIGTGRRPYISILALKVAVTPYSVDISKPYINLLIGGDDWTHVRGR